MIEKSSSPLITPLPRTRSKNARIQLFCDGHGTDCAPPRITEQVEGAGGHR